MGKKNVIGAADASPRWPVNSGYPRMRLELVLGFESHLGRTLSVFAAWVAAIRCESTRGKRLDSSRDEKEGTYRSGKGGGKSLITSTCSDAESELHLGMEEK